MWTIAVVMVLLLVILYLNRREFFEPSMIDEIKSQVKDAVDNNLDIIRFRGKYPNSKLTALQLNYLVGYYKNDNLTPDNIILTLKNFPY